MDPTTLWCIGAVAATGLVLVLLAVDRPLLPDAATRLLACVGWLAFVAALLAHGWWEGDLPTALQGVMLVDIAVAGSSLGRPAYLMDELCSADARAHPQWRWRHGSTVVATLAALAWYAFVSTVPA